MLGGCHIPIHREYNDILRGLTQERQWHRGYRVELALYRPEHIGGPEDSWNEYRDLGDASQDHGCLDSFVGSQTLVAYWQETHWSRRFQVLGYAQTLELEGRLMVGLLDGLLLCIHDAGSLFSSNKCRLT